MTILDDRQLADWFEGSERAEFYPTTPRPAPTRPARPRPNPQRPGLSRPGPVRPSVAPVRYRGTGVRMSGAVHTRRPVSTALSVTLAGLAALITLWLGSLAQFSGERVPGPAEQSDRLAVVQVQAGETLQQLAGRVAPELPTGQAVQRIRELNKLETAAVDAGQTLIAPVG